MIAEKLRIVRKETVVVFVDECHLLWGDALGYVWGPKGARIELPMTNARERQTYYGALNLLTGHAMTFPAEGGNSDQTVRFLKSLRRRFQGRRVVVVWDGASYHRSDLVKTYLRNLNGERPEEERRIQCLRFAPNAPDQNPMEDVWLAAKNAVRKLWYTLETFRDVTTSFMAAIEKMTFQFEKLNWYGRLQLI